jgi:hypothetical protein
MVCFVEITNILRDSSIYQSLQFISFICIHSIYIYILETWHKCDSNSLLSIQKEVQAPHVYFQLRLRVLVFQNKQKDRKQISKFK